MEGTSIHREPAKDNTASMTAPEAVFWLQAILDDTLDPNYDIDAKRIEAVRYAIDVLRARED